jgi:hypothetical protein
MKKPLWSILFAVVAIHAITSLTRAGEFAADFKQYHSWEDEGQKQKAGKVFVKAEKSRMEFIQDGQSAGIMIVNPQKKAAWMLDTSEKTYMQIDFTENLWQLAKSGQTGHPDIKQTKLGQETVSGYLCEKIGYSYKDKSIGDTVVWLSNKLEYPVKWENKGTQGDSWFQLSNIKEGKLKDSLFEVPAGYKAMSMGAEETEDEDSGSSEVVKQDAKDLGRDAHDAAKQGVSDVMTDSIRKGVEGLFNK